MGFFKSLFSRGESFVPTPTQDIPGIQPIVVQAIESIFPSRDDQKNAFIYVLELKKRGRTFDDPRLLLALLSYSKGNIESLRTASLETHPHFWFEEIEPIFRKMKNAEEWVRALTKSQA